MAYDSLVKRLRDCAALVGYDQCPGLVSAATEAAALLEKNEPPKRPMFFLVQREGIYGRGVVGIFTTDAKAEEAARAAADEETDAHHEFACYALQSNMRVTLAYGYGSQQDDPVWRLKRTRKAGGRPDEYEVTIHRAGVPT